MTKSSISTLENTEQVIYTHPIGSCLGRFCTLHNRSEHSMRGFPQAWRVDRGIMERICPHGVGHPDPDEYKFITSPHLATHGCDGCCA
jgi:hypothetical protein